MPLVLQCKENEREKGTRGDSNCGNKSKGWCR